MKDEIGRMKREVNSRLGLFGCLTLMFSLAACARGPSMPTRLAPGTATPRPLALLASPVPTATPVPAMGEAYVLLRTSVPPYTYQFAFGPVTCLTAGAGCALWQSLPMLPGSNFAPGSNAPLHWSPDGSVALLYNPNTMRLHTFDPATQALQVIATDIPFSTDEFVWSPSGQWAAAAVQGETDYASFIAVVDPVSGVVRSVNAEWGLAEQALDLLSLTRMQYPLAWVTPNELLVYSARYQPDSSFTPLSPKKNVVEGGVYQLHVDTGAVKVVDQGPSWLQQPLVSPQGDRFMFAGVNPAGLNGFWMRATDNAAVDLFSLVGSSAHWSPDGQWVASIETQGGVHTLTVTGADGRPGQVFQNIGDFYAVYWLPDSQHLLVVRRHGGPAATRDETSLVVLSMQRGDTWTMDIPALNPVQYVVAGVSWRPVAAAASP